MKLSVIVPLYHEPYLQQHVDGLLNNSGLGDQLEVICVLDGYYPETPIKDDPRVRVVHLGHNRGMRGAINAGVAVSRGEFIMRTDSHCMFGERYDLIMTSECQPNWIMTARRYYLDPVKWEVMDIPYVDCEKLVIQGGVKFAGQKWDERAKEIQDQSLKAWPCKARCGLCLESGGMMSSENYKQKVMAHLYKTPMRWSLRLGKLEGN